MPTELIESDPKVGDLVGTSGENPVLVPPDPPNLQTTSPTVELPSVYANFSLAREPGGAYCIRITGPHDLTAADARRAATELTDAANAIAEIRVQQGFDN